MRRIPEVDPVEIETDTITVELEQVHGTAVDIQRKAVPGIFDRERAVRRPVLIAGLDPELPDADEGTFLRGKKRRQAKRSQGRAKSFQEIRHR